MRHARGAALFAFGMLIGSAPDLLAQSRKLKVTADDNRPVGYAYVTLDHGPGLITDEAGELTLPGQAKPVDVTIRRVGFEPWTGRIGTSDSISRVSMRRSRSGTDIGRYDPTDISLASAHTRAFYARWLQQQNGDFHATFLGPEEIIDRHAKQLSDLLKGVGGVTLTRPGALLVAYGSLGTCPMRVLLDGVLQCPIPGAKKEICQRDDWYKRSGGPFVPIDTLVSVSALQGIEVYAHPEDVPRTLNPYDGGMPGCGVIAIWTWSRRSKN